MHVEAAVAPTVVLYFPAAQLAGWVDEVVVGRERGVLRERDLSSEEYNTYFEQQHVHLLALLQLYWQADGLYVPAGHLAVEQELPPSPLCPLQYLPAGHEAPLLLVQVQA